MRYTIAPTPKKLLSAAERSVHPYVAQLMG